MIDSLPCSITDKIWPEPNSGCWLWSGAASSSGYGRARWRGKQAGVHRITWEAVHGPILGGLFVLHHCDNPPCCNPDHLFLGTQTDNMRDKVSKGRQARETSRRSDRTVLTKQHVIEIRKRCANGERGVAIAADFGVSRRCVFDIRTRRRWAHV